MLWASESLLRMHSLGIGSETQGPSESSSLCRNRAADPSGAWPQSPHQVRLSSFLPPLEIMGKISGHPSWTHRLSQSTCPILGHTAAGLSAERPWHCWCWDSGRRPRGHFQELRGWKWLRGRNGAWPISEDGKAAAGQGAGAISGDLFPQKASERKGKVLSSFTQ